MTTRRYGIVLRTRETTQQQQQQQQQQHDAITLSFNDDDDAHFISITAAAHTPAPQACSRIYTYLPTLQIIKYIRVAHATGQMKIPGLEIVRNASKTLPYRGRMSAYHEQEFS